MAACYCDLHQIVFGVNMVDAISATLCHLPPYPRRHSSPISAATNTINCPVIDRYGAAEHTC